MAPPLKRKAGPGGGNGAPAAKKVKHSLTDPSAQLRSLLSHTLETQEQKEAEKQLAKAVKKARTVEVQRALKKLRALKAAAAAAAAAEEGEKEKVEEAEKQLAYFKALKPPLLASSLLSHRLSKLPFLLPHLSSLTATLSTLPDLDPATVEAKALNKISASKGVGKAWEGLRRGYAFRMGVEPGPKKEVGAAAEKEQVKGKGKAKELPPLTTGGAGATKGTPASTQPQDEQQEALSEKDEEMLDAVDGFSSGSEDEADGMDEDPDLEGEDEDEDGLPDDDEIEAELARLGGAGSDSEDSEEEGDFSGSESEEDDAPVAPPPSSKKTKTKPNKPVTSTTFLPTLAGGYLSGSDSEEDRWAEKDDLAGEKKERKNRRGQRARQAIWERKYGKEAKHVLRAGTGGGPPSAAAATAGVGKAKEPTAAAPAVATGGGAQNATTRRREKRAAERAAGIVPAKKEKEKEKGEKKENANRAPMGAPRAWAASQASSFPQRPSTRSGPSTAATAPTTKPAAAARGGVGAGTKGAGAGGAKAGGGGAGGEKVHPSWAAKQLQKEKMMVAQPGGKKIVFD